MVNAAMSPGPLHCKVWDLNCWQSSVPLWGFFFIPPLFSINTTHWFKANMKWFTMPRVLYYYSFFLIDLLSFIYWNIYLGGEKKINPGVTVPSKVLFLTDFISLEMERCQCFIGCEQDDFLHFWSSHCIGSWKGRGEEVIFIYIYIYINACSPNCNK